MKTRTQTFAVLCVLSALVAVQHTSALSTTINTAVEARTTTTANKDTVGLRATATATTSAKLDAKMQARLTTGRDRANQEIDRRNKMMMELNTKIGSMIRVTGDAKANVSASLQAQIDQMTALRAKIAADTDIDTLKADIASITKAYRVFMLVMPQARIAAAADSINTTVTTMMTLGGKLETRVNAQVTAGKDTAALGTLLADMAAKARDAKVQADAAVALTVNLKPDNGDKTVMEANNQAFVKARADIKTAQSDLKTAREDARKIIEGLKKLGDTTVSGDVHATSTTSVQ